MKSKIMGSSLLLLVLFVIGCGDSGENVTQDSQAKKPGMSMAARKDKRGD